MQIPGLAKKGLRVAALTINDDREPTRSRWVQDLSKNQGARVNDALEVAPGGVAFRTTEDEARQGSTIGTQCVALALAGDDRITPLAAIEADLSCPVPSGRKE